MDCRQISRKLSRATAFIGEVMPLTVALSLK